MTKGDRVRLSALGRYYFKWHLFRHPDREDRLGTVHRQPQRDGVTVGVKWDGSTRANYYQRELIEVESK